MMSTLTRQYYKQYTKKSFKLTINFCFSFSLQPFLSILVGYDRLLTLGHIFNEVAIVVLGINHQTICAII